MGSALVADLVKRLSRRQLGSGLFPHVRWSAGRSETIEAAVFGATFVAHALRRAMPALDAGSSAVAQSVIDRVVAALRAAPDPDGRVRFLGSGSTFRPDVDDTACVWLGLGDAGEPCPPAVLDAIEAAALASGGYANDFDRGEPPAVELASTTMAIALLTRAGRRCDPAISYVAKETRDIEAGAVRGGFFFPSRNYAAFCVARSAIDFGVRGLEASAGRLARWVSRNVAPNAPLFERALALWVLEAAGGPSAIRASLRASIETSLPHADHESDLWFTGDPRSYERSGVELVGCPAVTEAILVDALLLSSSPARRLERPGPPGTAEPPLAPRIERLPSHDGVARFQVRMGGEASTVEVLRAGPGVKAYRVSGGWAIRYAGSESAQAMRAADALIAAGLDERMAEAPTSVASASAAGEPLVDLLRFLAASGTLTTDIAADVAELRSAVVEPEQAEVELSFKGSGDALLEGPRITFYQHRPDAERVLRVFARLSGGGAEAVASRLSDAAAGLPLHVGAVHGPKGRSAKLYVRTDGASRARLDAVLAACSAGLELEQLAGQWIHGIGIAVAPGATRFRVYVVVPRDRVTEDSSADRHALEGWDVSEDAPPALEARYVHYRARPLSWERAVALAAVGPGLAGRIRAGLDAAGGWHARFVGLPAKGDARSLYVTLGSRVPRSDDDGP